MRNHSLLIIFILLYFPIPFSNGLQTWVDYSSPNLNSNPFGLNVLPDGKLIACGNFTMAGGTTLDKIAKFDGTSWVQVGTNTSNYFSGANLYDVKSDANGNIYVLANWGGLSSTITKWNGSSWINIGSVGGFTDGFSQFEVTNSGGVYVTGIFSQIGSVQATNIAYFNGTVWSPLLNGIGNGDHCKMKLDSAGNLYVASQSTINGQSASLAKWNGSSWQILSTESINNYIRGMAIGENGDVYIGGAFTQIGVSSHNFIAKYSGSSWTGLGGGMTGLRIHDLYFHNGILYTVGNFTMAGTILADNYAEWNGSQWSTKDGGVIYSPNQDFDQVDKVIIDGNDNIVVSGEIYTSNYQNIAKWVPQLLCTNLSVPLNGTTGVSVNSNISWSPSAGATGYKLTIGTSPGGAQILNNADLGNVTTYDPLTDFPPNTTIYVKITPYNTNGDAMGCIEESFVTCSHVLTLTENHSPLSGTYQAAEMIEVVGNVSVSASGNVMLKAPLVKVSEQFNLGNLSNVTISPNGCEISTPFTCGTSTVTFTYNGSPVTYGTVVSAGGKCWLDRNLGASQVATSSTDAAAYGDLFQWGRGADGHQIRMSGITTTLSNTDTPGHGNFILSPNYPYDWRLPPNNNLWKGVNGVNNPCPDGYRMPTSAELDNERLSWSSNNPAGAFSSPLKLPMAGNRGYSNGNVYNEGSYSFFWSYTKEEGNFRTLNLENNNALLGWSSCASCGFSVRCIKDEGTVAAINSLNCSSSYIQGGLNVGILTNNVTFSIPYESGNGGSFNSQSITSSGVLGLTAYLYPGVLANGNGILTYIISGTPTSTGTATFNIDIFGQTCSIIVPVSDCGTSTVSFNYNGSPVTYGTVVSAGKCWLDRNLGASQVATSSTDAAAYGDLFQWGRGADGHQIRTSGTTSTLSGTDNPGHGNFIRALNSPYDWRSPGNSNLWQGLYGINNPCPNGFRVPTSLEMREEFDSWSIPSNAVGNFSSPLKLPIPGFRLENSQLSGVGTTRYYYTSDRAEFPNANYAVANGPNLYIVRAYGASVRCTKEENVGSIGNFECSQVIMSGTLNIGAQSTGVSAEIPYLGGNGGSHPGQTVSSTGVQGITAFTHPGLLAIGNGTLKYTFSGIPASTGIANFALNIGGQTCNLMIEVGNCGSYSVTFTYNGNPVTYGTSVSNGRCWLDRNLGASQVATSSTHSVAYGDLFQWGRIADGHQIRTSGTTSILSNIDNPEHGNFIVNTSGSLDWRSPQNNELWQGEYGINNPCPTGFRLPTENELNFERLSWVLNNSGGAFNSPLKLTRAGLRNNNGSLNGVGTSGCYWGTTNDGQNARYLNFSNSNALISSSNRASGLSIRCIRDESPEGNIGSLNCGSATISGMAFAGITTPPLTAIVDYTMGNGGSHSGQTVNSTGVNGLTAYVYPGVFSTGTGSLTYIISGTPLSAGIATFMIIIGGQTCSINVNVGTCGAPETFSYNGNLVTYGTVVSAGRCWLDRNLGASQVATSSTDALAYGDLFQWGRGADGHQRRNPLSGTTPTSSSTDSPGHGNFITTTSGNYDWRSPQNNNLWQGVNGINNPCPNGFRLPTTTEFEAEQLSWNNNNNSIGAYASPLKLPVNGYREGTDGSVYYDNSIGLYWSSSVDGSYSRCLYFDNGYSYLDYFYRSNGLSVRCIKD